MDVCIHGCGRAGIALADTIFLDEFVPVKKMILTDILYSCIANAKKVV